MPLPAREQVDEILAEELPGYLARHDAPSSHRDPDDEPDLVSPELDVIQNKYAEPSGTRAEPLPQPLDHHHLMVPVTQTGSPELGDKVVIISAITARVVTVQG